MFSTSGWRFSTGREKNPGTGRIFRKTGTSYEEDGSLRIPKEETVFFQQLPQFYKPLIYRKGQVIFGCLADFRSVVWPDFVRSFGRISFGRLAGFRSVVWPNHAGRGPLQNNKGAPQDWFREAPE